MGRYTSLRGALTLAAVAACVAPAGANSYGDKVGDTIVYADVAETSATDPLPLFGDPIVVLDSLLFGPSDFESFSLDGGSDSTIGTLTTTIRTLGLRYIDKVAFGEAGRFTLGGTVQDLAEASVQARAELRIVEVNFQPITPVTLLADMSFSPSGGQYSLAAGDGLGGGLQPWTGSLVIDVAAELIALSLPGLATKAELSYTNTLLTTTGAGASALIKKETIDGTTLTVYSSALIPEPITLVGVLLGVGVLAGRWVRVFRGAA